MRRTFSIITTNHRTGSHCTRLCKITSSHMHSSKSRFSKSLKRLTSTHQTSFKCKIERRTWKWVWTIWKIWTNKIHLTENINKPIIFKIDSNSRLMIKQCQSWAELTWVKNLTHSFRHSITAAVQTNTTKTSFKMALTAKMDMGSQRSCHFWATKSKIYWLAMSLLHLLSD